MGLTKCGTHTNNGNYDWCCNRDKKGICLLGQISLSQKAFYLSTLNNQIQSSTVLTGGQLGRRNEN